jgi:hypothetical protein
MLLHVPSPGYGQTLEAALDSYLSQGFSGAKKPDLPTIEEWSASHPNETVQPPGEGRQNAGPETPQDAQVKEWEGRWCMQSIANIDLADGVHVRRVALFYQPLVEQIWDKPLPPLPTEDRIALRQHGCRLVRILSEFEGNTNPRDLAETIAGRLPGKRSDEPGDLINRSSRKDFWQPVCSFHIHSFYLLFTHSSADHPAVLLEWKAETQDYGEPSSKNIDPEAGQPWLPLRAAMLAQLPQAPTLDMLAFLAPRAGDQWEQPRFFCDRQLVPVLRNWFTLAAHSTPEQHAAALLVADAVADRLSDCEEFIDSNDYVPPEVDKLLDGSYDDLKKNLAQLGIETDRSARPGPEFYTGNLIAQARKLASAGVVNELSWIATLDQRCQWSAISDADCADFIQSGEAFLLRFPADEWTPSVHLLLAEAYSITAAEDREEAAPTSQKAAESSELLARAAAHYRAWYSTSTNQRDRALVWEEIWGIEAGLGPRLMVPEQLRH